VDRLCTLDSLVTVKNHPIPGQPASTNNEEKQLDVAFIQNPHLFLHKKS